MTDNRLDDIDRYPGFTGIVTEYMPHGVQIFDGNIFPVLRLNRRPDIKFVFEKIFDSHRYL